MGPVAGAASSSDAWKCTVTASLYHSFERMFYSLFPMTTRASRLP